MCYALDLLATQVGGIQPIQIRTILAMFSENASDSNTTQTLWEQVNTVANHSTLNTLRKIYVPYFQTLLPFLEKEEALLARIRGKAGFKLRFFPTKAGFLIFSDDEQEAELGFQKLDQLLEIDGVSVAGMDTLEMKALLFGDPGTEVELTILRERETEPTQLTVTRYYEEVYYL